ncbi:ABC transporter ATP-binding protein [Ornithinimicrobium faecis]|uniref:ABC transporter ATP-binding protein n=1 Tax=Ornithinimicrobium faecis TaxID=2934158 RepID=UPI00211928EE|nr:ABC transporter ATP-binding protein [Ornithinimicrobium sp. HY1745]
MTAEPLLQVEDVTLRFGGNTVLDQVSFDVLPGELFAIIGPNGAGKTSTFNCLSGVYRPQEGELTFRGETLRGQKPDRIARRGIARTFQNIELFDNLTVLENLLLGRHHALRVPWWQAMAWLPSAQREEVAARLQVEHIIDFLGLAAVRNLPVGILPYGIKKRIELGRALAMDPELLLLDEPVAGMNSEETEDMARFILDIRGELGVSMIMVEHDMRLVMDLADRVMVIDFGRRIALGTPEQVQRDPAVIAAYLGGASEEVVAAVADTELTESVLDAASTDLEERS